MSPAADKALRFPCRSGACGLRGLALIAFWIALVIGFVAQTTLAEGAPPGRGQSAAEAPAQAAGHTS